MGSIKIVLISLLVGISASFLWGGENPLGLPSVPIPSGNPQTPEKITLGKRLFEDKCFSADGPIKTSPLLGIKDSPPYLHDGRLLTLEDTVEFFNLIVGLGLSAQEKMDMVEFMRSV